MVGALTQGRELRDFDRRDEKRVRCDAASKHSAKDPNCSKCGVRLLPEREITNAKERCSRVARVD